MKDEIKMVLRKQFQAGIDKHAMNVRVMMNNPMAMSPRDAARSLGISRSTLYRLIQRGGLRTVKIGRRTLVPTSALAELINELSSDTK